MVAPAYTTDLTTMDDAQSGTGWAEATASGWTSVFAVTGGETDDFIQNNACNSTTVKTGVGALLYDNGSGITLNTDDAVLVWAKWDVSPSLDVEANGGIRTVQGSALNAFYAFTHLGSDSYIYGGWRNLATGDRADSEITEDYTAGSPSTTKQFHGWAFNALSVPSKGNPYKVDAIRYGRCEIRVNGGETADYATFAGMAAVNDLNVTTFNRWGLFQAVPGGFLWKGLMTLGYTSAVDFRDSATNITIDDTKHTTANFNKIEIRQASSRVDWTGVSFVALGTKSPGRIEVIDNADVNFSECSFSDMDSFTFLSNTTATSTKWARCGLITLGEADISGSSILTPTVAADEGAVFDDRTTTVATSITELDNCTFTQGTNAHHAIRFGANVNDDITLTGIEFTGFSSTADAAGATLRFDATSGTMNCNLVGCTVGGAAASAANVGVDDAAGITVTVAAAVSVSFEAVTSADAAIENVLVTVYKVSDNSEVFNGRTNASGIASFSFTDTTPVDCYYRYRKASDGATKYINLSGFVTIAAGTGASVKRSMTVDPNNPGTVDTTLGFWAKLTDSGTMGAIAVPTFTRASTGTYLHPGTGLVTSAATNQPRFEAGGILIEESRENICLRSEEFDNASWLKINTGTGITPTVSSNFATAPDGTTTADRVQCDLNGGTAGGDQSWVEQAFSGLANPHDSAASVWIKSNTGVNQNVRLDTALGGAGGLIVVTPVWQRFLVSNASTGFTTDRIVVGALGTQTDDVLDLLCWGGQFEVALFQTSYIPTTTIAVTRSADFLSYDDDTLIIDAAGSIYMEVTPLFDSTEANDAVLLNVTDAQVGPMYVLDSTTQQVSIGDGTTVNSRDPTFVRGTTHKVATRWSTAADDIQAIADGTATTAGAYDDVFTRTAGTMYVGSDSTGNHFNGNIKNLKIYNVDRGQSQLETDTT